MKPAIVISDIQLKKMNGGGQTVAKILLKNLGKFYDFTYLGYPLDFKMKSAFPFKSECAVYENDSYKTELFEFELVKKAIRSALHRSKYLRNKLLKQGELETDLVISNSVYDDFVMLQDSNFKLRYKAAIFVNHNPYFSFNKVYPDRLLDKKPFKLIALNKTAFNKLAKKYGAENVKLIYNGFDYKPLKTDLKYLSRLGVNKRDKVILSIGRLNDVQKKFSYGIRAFKQISRAEKNVFYLVAGVGSDRAKYENLINNLGLAGRVKLLGFVSDIEKNTLLKRADILLSPSIKETFGIVTLEGLRNGTIVLTTENEGSKDLIDNGKNGFFVRAVPSEIAEKCLWVFNLSNSEKRKISKNAVKSARKFTIKQMVHEYKEVIEELLEKVYKQTK